jgi:hypothetical protein
MANRELYQRASAALDAAHKACFEHPDRGPTGMSHGAFSGVNVALGIVAQLEDENDLLHQKLNKLTHPLDRERLMGILRRCENDLSYRSDSDASLLSDVRGLLCDLNG